MKFFNSLYNKFYIVRIPGFSTQLIIAVYGVLKINLYIYTLL